MNPSKTILFLARQWFKAVGKDWKAFAEVKQLLLFLIAVMDTAGVDLRHRRQNILESLADDAARYQTGQGSLAAV